MDTTSSPRASTPTLRRLLAAAQNGDPTAEQQLFRRYEPLVRSVVWKLRPPPGCERQDLAQEARIGLLAAIRTWSPERGPFPALAERCVQNQALLAVEAAARHKHQVLSRAVRLDAATGSQADDWDRLRPLDHLVASRAASLDPEACLQVREQLRCVVRALPTLTPNERLALAGRLADESYEWLGLSIGGTPKAASQAVYRARRKLAAALARAA